MSFLSGIMGGGKGNNMVDQAVDKVADVAKVKVKEMMGGETKTGDQAGNEGGGGASTGGLGGLGGLLSFGDDSKKKQESSAASGVSTESSGAGGGGELDLADTLGDIAGEMAAGKKDDNKPADQLLSFGKSLFG